MSCEIKIDDYETKRSDKITQINKYYKSILKDYNQVNTEYNDKRTSSNTNNRQYASTQLAPKQKAFQDQVYNINRELYNEIVQNTNLIKKQKEELDYIKTQTYDTRERIRGLKDNMKYYKNNINSHSDNMESINKNIENNEFYITAYQVVCVILLIIIVVGIMFVTVYIPSSITSTSISVGKNNTRLNNYAVVKK